MSGDPSNDIKDNYETTVMYSKFAHVYGIDASSGDERYGLIYRGSRNHELWHEGTFVFILFARLTTHLWGLLFPYVTLCV